MKRMARDLHDVPVAILPQGRTLYDDDPIFDYTLGERAKVIAGYLLLSVLALALLLFLSLPGQN